MGGRMRSSSVWRVIGWGRKMRMGAGDYAADFSRSIIVISIRFLHLFAVFFNEKRVKCYDCGIDLILIAILIYLASTVRISDDSMKTIQIQKFEIAFKNKKNWN